MGCPEEILSALDELQGIEFKKYEIDTGEFIITYDLKQLNINDIVQHINNRKFEVVDVDQIKRK